MPADISRPLRTCVGCREISAQADLVRLALVDGQLVLDLHRLHSGRGAYLHPRADCGQQAIARRAFDRAFRLRLGGNDLPSDWDSLIHPISPTPNGA